MIDGPIFSDLDTKINLESVGLTGMAIIINRRFAGFRTVGKSINKLFIEVVTYQKFLEGPR